MKWIKRYKVFHDDLLRTIHPSLDGKLFIAGNARENFNQQSGGSVLKIDTAGNVIWHKVYSDSYDDGIIHVTQQADSSLVFFNRQGVSGYPIKVIHTDKNGSMILAGQANTASGAQALAFKVSNNGSVQFCKSYGNLAYQYFYDGFMLNDGR